MHESVAYYWRNNGFNLTEDGYPQEDGYRVFLGFSQYQTRVGFGKEPIIATTMNSVKPCYGTDRNRLVVGDAQNRALISFPLEREAELLKCPEFDWRNNV